MVRHWTPKPVIICSIRSSPTGGTSFFAVVKFFEYKIAISANFVQTVKDLNDGYSGGGTITCLSNGQWSLRPTCTGINNNLCVGDSYFSFSLVVILE